MKKKTSKSESSAKKNEAENDDPVEEAPASAARGNSPQGGATAGRESMTITIYDLKQSGSGKSPNQQVYHIQGAVSCSFNSANMRLLQVVFSDHTETILLDDGWCVVPK